MQAMDPPGPSQQGPPDGQDAQLPGGFPGSHSPFLTAPAFAYMPVSLVSYCAAPFDCTSAWELATLLNCTCTLTATATADLSCSRHAAGICDLQQVTCEHSFQKPPLWAGSTGMSDLICLALQPTLKLAAPPRCAALTRVSMVFVAAAHWETRTGLSCPCTNTMHHCPVGDQLC